MRISVQENSSRCIFYCRENKNNSMENSFHAVITGHSSVFIDVRDSIYMVFSRTSVFDWVVQSTRHRTSKMLAKSTATCLVSSNHTPSNVNGINSLIVHSSANHSLSKELENLELKNE